MLWNVGGTSVGSQEIIEPAAGGFMGAGYFSPGGSADTWTAYQQLDAAIPYACAGFFIEVFNRLSMDSACQIQFAIGPASSEVNVVRIPWAQGTVVTAPRRVYVPMFLPKGVRLSARCIFSSSSAGNAFRLGVAYVPMTPLCGFTSYGVEYVNLPDSVAMPTGTADRSYSAGPPISGTITELIASTAHDWRAVSVHFASTADLVVSNEFTARLLIGPSGSERILHQWVAGDTARQVWNHGLDVLPCRVPRGSRVSIELIENFSAGSIDTNYPVVLGWL